MTDSSTQNDTMELSFYNQANSLVGSVVVSSPANGSQTNNPGSSINNYTEVNMEKDYFVPANGLTVTIEDDRISQITGFLQRGFKVKVSINGNPNMIGYIFDYRLHITRHGGTQLILQCKDLLEYMAQGTVYPNMGTGSKTNFHFKPTDTLQTALNKIADAFSDVINGQSFIIDVENAQSLTFASGFQVGLRIKGKTPAGRVKSLSTSLNHLTTPQKGETYLAYMLRLCKHAGCNLKMSDNDEGTIICKPPTYDRENPSPFKLIHYVSFPNNLQNNVLEAHYRFSLDKQPSVVIVEANTTGDGKFYQSTLKGIAVNEMTGYPLVQGATPQPINAVNDAVMQLTNGNSGTGYVKAPFNDRLYATRAALAVDIGTQVSMPYYTVDYNAHTKEEVSFAASKILAEHQDRYVEFKYKVQGWTMPGTNAVWQPDMMVSITEEVFSPGGTSFLNIPMWIRRVNYIKTRHGGTEVELTCQLPYTHNFEINP